MQTQTMETSPTAVKILEDLYYIRGDADPGYVSELAEMVDTRMRELRSSSRTPLNARKLAIITAINLADELKKREQEQDTTEEKENLEVRASQLISLLDEGLSGDRFDS